MDDKSRLFRLAGIAARLALSPEDRAAAEQRICGLIASDSRFLRAETVLSYLARGGEPSLAGIECIPGKRIAYPFCTDSSHMIALLPLDASPRVHDACGLPAPDPAHSQLILPEALDLVLCPCTAFHDGGIRLGSGRGYYDRYLPGCTRAHVLSAAFSVQKQEGLTAAPWDFLTEGTVTELGIR